MKLDVGCGNHPKGDVNVDVRTVEVNVFYAEPINIKSIPNFVKADAEHLPFKDKVFSECISSHTIEHVENPFLAVKEMQRVTYGKVKFVTPLWFSHEYLSWLRPRCHKHWILPHWFTSLGFHTNIRLTVQRPTLLRKPAPFWFPFFEIVAYKTVETSVRKADTPLSKRT